MVHMNVLEKAQAEILGRENLEKIQRVKVGIAGAGGLGSNCALFLVRSGFKKFKIVDFDVVEAGNLNRQYYFASQVGRKKVDALRENLLLVNPGLEIETVPEKIEKESLHRLFSGCHVVVEAMDRAEYKKTVVESFMNSGKLLVAASGLAGWGKSDRIKTRRVKNNFYLVGDQETETGPGCPALAPGVNVAAAKQADVVLSYFLGAFSEGGDDHS